MTDQRELDRLLGAFFADGTNELADRVIDAALDQIDHIRQRRTTRMPRRLGTLPMLTRVAAVAVFGIVAVGGAFFLLRPGQTAVVGGPGTTATAAPTVTPTVTPAPTASPTPTPTPTAQAGLTGPLVVGRQIHTATTLADGRVLVAGGFDDRDGALASAVIFDPTKNAFSPTGSLAEARGWHTATLLADERVLIAGGGPPSWATGQGPFLASAELFDPTTGTFSPTGSMTSRRTGHTATLLANGRVLIAGGNDTDGHGVASAELYDPRTGTFSATGSMTSARTFHTATLLTDGRVLITGGDPSAWTTSGPFIASAEIYDPKTGTFSATGPMSVGRELHTATVLDDGRVLITGGVTNGSPAPSLASAELYDPRTGTFSATGSMISARVYQTATLLADGRVLIAGGLEHGRAYADNPQFLASAELYDPTSGTFSATGPMSDRRVAQTANVLADGRVLVAAGVVDNALTTLANAEIYDPKTGTFSPGGMGG